MTGRVVSTKLKQTATVLVERVATHPLYKKTYLRSKKYLVDDVIGVSEGDIVEIVKCKPVSKNKHWKIVKVVGKNLAEIVEAEQKKAAEEVIAEVMPEPESQIKSEDQKISGSEESDTPKNRKTKTPISSGKKKTRSKKETK